jgi:DNA-binding MarR family transcriptional regulator
LNGISHRTRIEILYFLYENPDTELGKIAEFINSTQQNTTNHVQKMMYGGLIMKKQSGNLVLHKLTKRGMLFISFFENLSKKI